MKITVSILLVALIAGHCVEGRSGRRTRRFQDEGANGDFSSDVSAGTDEAPIEDPAADSGLDVPADEAAPDTAPLDEAAVDAPSEGGAALEETPELAQYNGKTNPKKKAPITQQKEDDLAQQQVDAPFPQSGQLRTEGDEEAAQAEEDQPISPAVAARRSFRRSRSGARRGVVSQRQRNARVLTRGRTGYSRNQTPSRSNTRSNFRSANSRRSQNRNQNRVNRNARPANRSGRRAATNNGNYNGASRSNKQRRNLDSARAA